LAARAAAPLQRLAFRSAMVMLPLLLAMLVGTVAIVFAFVGLYLALCEVWHAPAAAGATALAALVIAVLLLLLSRERYAAARGEREHALPPLDGKALAAQLGKLLGSETAALANGHPKGMVIASLAAGFAVGAVPELRALLKSALDNYPEASK
jgi:hypothetical protein